MARHARTTGIVVQRSVMKRLVLLFVDQTLVDDGRTWTDKEHDRTTEKVDVVQSHGSGLG